jgi:hypothetical protein
MPRKYAMTRSRRGMRGKGLMSIIKKIGKFLHKTKLVSTIGRTLGEAGIPLAGKIGRTAGLLGYGRCKKHTGRGIRRSGGSLRRAGYR